MGFNVAWQVRKRAYPKVLTKAKHGYSQPTYGSLGTQPLAPDVLVGA